MTIAALAASGAAQAQPNAGFCADLQAIVAAGRETPPFASLPNWSRNGRPMLAFELCGTNPDNDGSLHFVCTRYDPARLSAPPGLGLSGTLDYLASRIELCLPLATRTRDERPIMNPRARQRIQSWEDHVIDVHLDGLRFSVTLTVRPRFTWLELQAYDVALREAYLAAQAERWRQAREAADERD
ncbi:MAG: hypothetical protein KF780_11800 [Sphingomonas sp.]|nr:hypothetical protein [Sphingomonas sp.]